MGIALAAGPSDSRRAAGSDSTLPCMPNGSAAPGSSIPEPSALNQVKIPLFEHPEGAPNAPKLGTKATPTDTGNEKTTESPPLGERPMPGNVEAHGFRGGHHGTSGFTWLRSRIKRKRIERGGS